MGKEKRDSVRDYIIEVASLQFGKFGFKKTTLDDIAVASGKGKTGLYYYFKNKEDVFKAVIEKEADKLKSEILTAVEKHEMPADKFKAYVLARMNTLKKVAAFYEAMKSELFEQINFIDKVRDEFEKNEVLLVSNIISAGNISGQFYVKQPEVSAFLIVAMLKGLEIPLYLNSSPKQTDKYIKEVIALLSSGLNRKSEV